MIDADERDVARLYDEVARLPPADPAMVFAQLEGAAILAEIEAMSQQNVAELGFRETAYGPDGLPAGAALRRILRADVSPSEWWLYGDERRYCHDAVDRAFCKGGERDEHGLGPSGAELRLALDEAYERRNAHWQVRCDVVAERSDGDRPAQWDGSDERRARIGNLLHQNRTPLGRVLFRRAENLYDLPQILRVERAAVIRDTHPQLHRALTGATSGPTIRSCEWCAWDGEP